MTVKENIKPKAKAPEEVKIWAQPIDQWQLEAQKGTEICKDQGYQSSTLEMVKCVSRHMADNMAKFEEHELIESTEVDNYDGRRLSTGALSSFSVTASLLFGTAALLAMWKEWEK